MKKLFAISIAVCILVASFAGGAGFAALAQAEALPDGETGQTEVSTYYAFDADSTPLDVLKDFVSSYPDRTPASQGEKDAAKYLELTLENLGITAEMTEFRFRDPLFDELRYSNNVKGVIQGESDKKVILVAHYDNLASYGTEETGYIGGEGAGDNGSGVATLLYTAYLLKQGAPLDFTVEFVLTGADSGGLFGSLAYVEQMQGRDIDNTLLVINLDALAIGDYLYMYADEVKTLHFDYFYDIASAGEYGIKAPPKNKNVIWNTVPFQGYTLTPYTHIGLMSSNSVFMNAGMNSLSFFGSNWENHFSITAEESSTKPGIAGTDADTLENFLELYGETANQRCTRTAELIASALVKDDFASVMENSRKEKFDYSFISEGGLSLVVLAVIAAAGLVLAILYYRKLKNIQDNAQKEEDKTDNNQKPSQKVFEDF